MEAALGKSGEVVKEEKTQKRVEPSRDEQGHKEGNFLYKVNHVSFSSYQILNFFKNCKIIVDEYSPDLQIN